MNRRRDADDSGPVSLVLIVVCLAVLGIVQSIVGGCSREAHARARAPGRAGVAAGAAPCTLSLTLPAYDQVPGSRCLEGLIPCSDLAVLEVWGYRQCLEATVPPWDFRPCQRPLELLRVQAIAGRAGQRDTVLLPARGGAFYTLLITVRDSAGNRSCESNLIGRWL